jgi:hypothetical protein
MGVKMEVSPDLKKLLDPARKKHVEHVLQKTRVEIGEKINIKIKEDGFVPRDTGKLARSHRMVSNKDGTYIVSNRKASNGVPLWIYITSGHETLTTEKSRRWWFAYLKNVLGGNYTRKTNGPPGYVPPNDYHKRAVAATPIKQVIKKMMKDIFK